MINGMFRRPCEVEFLPPGEGWSTKRPDYLAAWKDRLTSFIRKL